MEYFRRVTIVNRALLRGERGPLVWSGQLKTHPDVRPGEYTVDWCVAFWFWVPPEKRDRRNLETAPTKFPVSKLSEHERRALAEGVIEEEWINITFPGAMPVDARYAWLREHWQRRCFERLGFVPDATGVGAGRVGIAGKAEAVEFERRKVAI